MSLQSIEVSVNSYRALLILLALVAILSPSPMSAQTATRPTVTNTTIEGIVTWASPTEVQVKTLAATDPLRVSMNTATSCTDENGAPLSLTAVTQGQQVMIYYSNQGDTLLASKIVIKRVVGANPGGQPGRPAVNAVP